LGRLSTWASNRPIQYVTVAQVQEVANELGVPFEEAADQMARALARDGIVFAMGAL
jgi:hypothetical protein